MPSIVEHTQSIIDRTDALDSRVKAFIHRDPEDALAQARAREERLVRGEQPGLLEGVVVGVKDVLTVKGQPCRCASRILEDFVSPYDAHVIERLRAEGAILWGRLNMDEFAMGSSCENSGFQLTHNPWDLTRTPGGSSGGSAAAAAAGMCDIALGTDTGGSIRQPAAYCGIVGLKPTYGLVSRYGLVAFASSLDQIGPMGRTVEDCARLLQVIAGHDSRDSTSLKTDLPDYVAAIRQKPDRWKIGIPREYFGDGLQPEVREAVEKAIDFYRSQGAELTEVSLPHMEYSVPVYYILAPAEASSNLARYDGVRYSKRAADAKSVVDLYSRSRGQGFGQEVKRRILLGTYALSSGYYDAYYVRAQKVRTLIRNDFLKVFQDVDALLTPTTPHTPFILGEKIDDPLAMYLEDIYTISVNLAGLPGISVPCGFVDGKLPVGMQLIGKPFDESLLLRMAHQFEQAHDFYTRQPQL